jgi:hypothetical protein
MGLFRLGDIKKRTHCILGEQDDALLQKTQIVCNSLLSQQDYSTLKSIVTLFCLIYNFENNAGFYSLYLKQEALYEEYTRLCNEIEKKAGEFKQSGDMEKYKEYILFAYARSGETKLSEISADVAKVILAQKTYDSWIKTIEQRYGRSKVIKIKNDLRKAIEFFYNGKYDLAHYSLKELFVRHAVYVELKEKDTILRKCEENLDQVLFYYKRTLYSTFEDGFGKKVIDDSALIKGYAFVGKYLMYTYSSIFDSDKYENKYIVFGEKDIDTINIVNMEKRELTASIRIKYIPDYLRGYQSSQIDKHTIGDADDKQNGQLFLKVIGLIIKQVAWKKPNKLSYLQGTTSHGWAVSFSYDYDHPKGSDYFGYKLHQHFNQKDYEIEHDVESKGDYHTIEVVDRYIPNSLDHNMRQEEQILDTLIDSFRSNEILLEYYEDEGGGIRIIEHF